MAAAATTTYTGDGVIPCWAPEKAITDAVQLVPGTYVAGTVIGQFTTLTVANDVQTITVTGTPTGGTVRYAFNGEVTGAIAYNASAAVVQAAFEALTQIGTGGVVGTGGALPGTPVVLTFSGTYTAGRWMPLITLFSNSLTGGTDPTSTIAHTTPGRTAGGAWAAYDDAQTDGTNIARAILKHGGTVNTFGHHAFGGGEWGSVQRSAPAYFAGYFKTKDLTGIDAAGVTDLGRIVRGAVGSLTAEHTVLAIF